MVKAFKELKALEKKVNKNHEEEIHAIKRIDIEIEKLERKVDSKKEEGNDRGIRERKKCKFFNRGYCRYKSECKFAHPGEICKIYLEEKKCNDKTCADRHPKVCKWWLEGKCRRNDCEYLHVTLVRDDDKPYEAHKFFPCYGCKNCYDDKTCVVQYIVQNRTIFLCLNCDGWIK